MLARRRPLAGLVALICAAGAHAQQSEEDFLAPLPQVTSVTRLPQAQSEAPGAVTVLTRETIHNSGARDLVDLLRMVPGMFVAGWSGAHRIASYHVSLDEYAQRLQVFIDGRSVYSTYYLGGASTALTTLPLEEVERVEVLRGANSAAFGTNAMFGVVNITTRHAGDTQGTQLRLASGENGVRDAYLAHGSLLGGGALRLAAAVMNDDGFRNAEDDRRTARLSLRADFAPSADSQLVAQLGATRLRSSDGFADKPDNALRPTEERELHAALSWRKALSPDHEVRLSLNHTTERFENRFIARIGPFSVDADQGGSSTRTEFEFQHTATLAPQWRWVWGIGARGEEIDAPLYFNGAKVEADRLQLFANAEWRPRTDLIINAGGMLERHDGAGSEFAPRLAANFQLSPTQTLRAATTSAFRMPTLFEGYANTWLRDIKTGTPLLREYYVRTVPAAERVRTHELGYLQQWPTLHLDLDVRVFDEQVTRLLNAVKNTAKAPHQSSTTVVSSGELGSRGVEYQLRWQPARHTEFRLAQTRAQASAPQGSYFANNVAERVDQLALRHRFGNGLEFGAAYSAVGAVSSRGWNKRTPMPALDQLDLRLAYHFRAGATPVEVALDWIAADGAVPAYNLEKSYAIPRQAILTLRTEI